MKKAIAIALFASLLLGMWGCAPAEESKREQSKTEQSVSEISVLESSVTEDSTDEEKDALQAEIDRLKEELSQLNEEIESEKQAAITLRMQISDLEERIVSMKSSVILRSIPIKGDSVFDNDRVLLVQDISGESLEFVLYLRYDGGETVEIGRNLVFWNGYIDPSPDGKQIVMNDFSLENESTVYLYDVENRVNRELSFDLPQDRTVSAMRWLDERYFLFVSQLDHGSVVRGGNVYYYDTETDTCGLIIDPSTPLLQINEFDRYDDFMFMTAALYEETYNFTDDKHFAVTYEQIYDLIENGKVLTLDPKDGK